MTEDNPNRITIDVTVNAEPKTLSIPVETTLQKLLHHDLGLKDVRFGCGEGVCGACTVLVDGAPVCSCLTLAVQMSGKRITTAAGLEHDPVAVDADKVKALKDQLVTREAFQCGYCACGVMVSAAHHVSGDPSLTHADARRALSGNICRCSGYDPLVKSLEAAREGTSAAECDAGQRDLRDRMEGISRYPTDTWKQEALVAKVLWSEWPAADILSIDTSEAKALPGVEAVLTHTDIPGKNQGGNGIIDNDEPFLASGRVRSRSDAIALVAAQSEAIAMDAVARIKVVYRPRAAVTDARNALESSAPRVHPNKSNIIADLRTEHGDAEEALKKADLVVSGRFGCGNSDHSCIEPEGGSAWMEDGTLVLAVPTQTPHRVRRFVARLLSREETSVRVVAPRMGGSFGKYLMTHTEGYLALLAEKTGQPVRLVLNRAEMLGRSSKRHFFTGDYTLGAMKDGRIVALKADLLADAGAYSALTPTIVSLLAVEAEGAYDIQNVSVWARGVVTNNLVAAPMRGYGSQQVTFGIEAIVDKAARALDLDPVAMRKTNFLSRHIEGTGTKRAAPEVRQVLSATMDMVIKRLGDRPDPPSKNWRIGRGFAATHAKYGYPYGLVDRFVARIAVDGAGTWHIGSDIGDAGTGFTRGLPRLVMERFKLSRMPVYAVDQAAIDDPTGDLMSSGRAPGRWRARGFRLIERLQMSGAKVLRDDKPLMQVLRRLGLASPIFRAANGTTAWVKNRHFPFGIDSYLPRVSGSRSYYMGGRAVLDAVDRIQTTGRQLAARSLGVSPEEVMVIKDGFAVTEAPSKTISWAALASSHQTGQIAAVGEAHLPRGRILSATGNQVGPVDFMHASHGCDLAVNPETGEVRILNYAACHDVGKIHDEHIIRGQLVGGIAMGIGQALFEKVEVVEGIVRNQGMHEYGVPTSLDIPKDVTVDLLESGDGLGPRGAKGVGEAGAVVSPSAIVSALNDALGVEIESIPVMPEKIVALSGRIN
ncbi:hypothetical protein So717_03890 [Roseobacter cerasinus]|uniref:2Fe-2S ferredoxin-type domain-containing protein n=1 Tax=Roseobacter cerasinus TaxID=2602289 RepID=A0A640VQZ6_9RHOB|nr:molybdopterin cofactor-binding domain-containing protein [Roseobacter cerasinus]GFE48636.1 hypothetical protein So717_03890 [Roseobacter cerasinus]